MKQQNSLKISVVVPCYNEQANIVACINSLIAQNQKLFEIILVDNNSTDQTAMLAKKFKNVIVINEPKQGLISARNCGMNHARGDIIARIDADSRPASNWSQVIAESFVDNDIQAITGTGYFYDAPLKQFIRGLRNIVAVYINNKILGHGMLWGSNMAVRSSCWRAIGYTTCNQANIMEDLDLSTHIFEEFGASSIAYVPNMRADISARRAMAGLKANYLYLSMWPITLKMHGYFFAPFAWPVIGFMLALSPVAVTISKLYDSPSQKFVFRPSQWRAKNYEFRDNP